MAGAAAVIKSNVSRSGTKGNRTPKKTTQRSDKAAASRVGGYPAAKFDNASLGRP